MTTMTRGTLATDSEGVVFIVWGVTAGVAHLIPINSNWSPTCRPVPTRLSLAEIGADCFYQRYAMTAVRRHIRAEDLGPCGRLSAAVIADIERAIAEEWAGVQAA